MAAFRKAWGWLEDRLGGRARLKVVAVLASVLALDGADKGAVGAMAGPLQRALGVGKTELGLLLTVSLGMGALCTLFFGWLVDRLNRTRLLCWVVLAWGGAMVLCATATSYLYLLLTRLALGGVTACAAPGVASLLGDYIPQRDRAGIYSAVLAGEFVGTGAGFLVSGELASWTWRAGFAALALPALVLAWALHRLPEPARGGRDRLAHGQEDFGGPTSDDAREERQVPRLVDERGIEPRQNRLIEGDPQKKSMLWAVKYVMRVPSNVVLILASALGYFFFAGIRTFGAEYLRHRYGLAHAVATAMVVVLGSGALLGVLSSGRIADALIRRGKLRARIGVALTAYLVTCGILLAALITGGLWLGMILLALAAASLGAVNPPLDAARLDVMPHGLWGRAEAVRTFLRQGAEAAAPLIFGWVAEALLGSVRETFLVMLIPLAAGGLIGLIGLRTYPRDVATAAANEARSAGG